LSRIVEIAATINMITGHRISTPTIRAVMPTATNLFRGCRRGSAARLLALSILAAC